MHPAKSKCKYCGHEASRQSDEDCPAKPQWRKYLGRAVVVGALCHWLTHIVPVALAISMVMKGC